MDTGLIFGMIVAIFLIGLIIVYGYQQIDNMQRMQCFAETKNALASLATATDRIYSLSGETSEKFKLSFPGCIAKVCFMPFYRGTDPEMKSSKLRVDLNRVLAGTPEQKYQMMNLLASMRISPAPMGGYVDKNQTVLIIYQETIIPDWENVRHLEPTKKSGTSALDILCVRPNSEVWLRRKFDSQGAWVDVEQA